MHFRLFLFSLPSVLSFSLSSLSFWGYQEALFRSAEPKSFFVWIELHLYHLLIPQVLSFAKKGYGLGAPYIFPLVNSTPAASRHEARPEKSEEGSFFFKRCLS